MNEGLQAVERARAHHTSYHHHNYHTTPSRYREEEEEVVERGGKRSDQEPSVPPRTIIPAVAPVVRTLSSQIQTDEDGGLGSNERPDSYCDLTHIGSLSRTYTFPNVQTFPADQNCSYYQNISSIGSSAPCLTASYFRPLPIPEGDEREDGEEEEEEVCPLPVVVVGVGESPKYMHLSPLTLEEPNHYQTLVKTQRGGGGGGGGGKGWEGGERQRMMGSAVAKGLGKSRRKPPPKLIAGKERSNRAKKNVEHRHGQSLPSPTERGGAEERHFGQPLSQSSAALSRLH